MVTEDQLVARLGTHGHTDTQTHRYTDTALDYCSTGDTTL